MKKERVQYPHGPFFFCTQCHDRCDGKTGYGGSIKGAPYCHDCLEPDEHNPTGGSWVAAKRIKNGYSDDDPGFENAVRALEDSP